MVIVAITPDTEIRLLAVPFERDYSHTCDFSSVSAQTSYMQGQTKHTFQNYTYRRQDSVLCVGANIDTLYDSNYVMYQNSNYTNKWFYAFIDRMEYVNANATNLYLTTDVIQTWWFDLMFKPCFVVREHTNDDSIGANLISENLEKGEYKYIQKPWPFDKILLNSEGNFDCAYILASTEIPEFSGEDITFKYGSTIIGGNLYNLLFYAFFDIGGSSNENYSKIIETLSNNNKGTSMVSTFKCPKICFTTPYVDGILSDTQIYRSYMGYISKFTNLDGYFPKNNKLFTAEYNAIYVSTPNGIGNEYYTEYFLNDTFDFDLQAQFALTPQLRLVPENYTLNKYDATLPLSGFGSVPNPSNISASLLNQTQQSFLHQGYKGLYNTLTAIGNSGANAIKAFLTGDLISSGESVSSASGALANYAFDIAGLMAARKQLYYNPITSHGNFSDLNSVLPEYNFRFYQRCINSYYAKIIDDYFSMFGYATHEVKVPNITGRKNWNYVQTRNSIILGDVPQDDIEKIKSIFNNGITFWHSPANVGNYNLPNPIV